LRTCSGLPAGTKDTAVLFTGRSCGIITESGNEEIQMSERKVGTISRGIRCPIIREG